MAFEPGQIIDRQLTTCTGCGHARDAASHAGYQRRQVRDIAPVSVQVREHRAWFLEHERLTTARAKAVKDSVNTLCATLRPHARSLVDAFGLSDEWLAAPIALGEEEARQKEQRGAVFSP